MMKNTVSDISDGRVLLKYYYYRPQGKAIFSQASVILSTIGLMPTWSLLILVGYSVTCCGAVFTHPTGMLSCWIAYFFMNLRSIATNRSLCNFLTQYLWGFRRIWQKNATSGVVWVTIVDPHPARGGYLLPARFTACHLRRTSEWTDPRASHAPTCAHGAQWLITVNPVGVTVPDGR